MNSKYQDSSTEREKILVELAKQKAAEGLKEYTPITLEMLDARKSEVSIAGFDMFKLVIKPPATGQRKDRRELSISNNGFVEFIEDENYEGVVVNIPYTEWNKKVLVRGIKDGMYTIKQKDILEEVLKEREKIEPEIAKEKKEREAKQAEYEKLSDKSKKDNNTQNNNSDDIIKSLNAALQVINEQKNALKEAQEQIAELKLDKKTKGKTKNVHNKPDSPESTTKSN